MNEKYGKCDMYYERAELPTETKNKEAIKIVTLTLSAAYDVHCYAKKIDVGRENFVTLSESDAGGKGINISRALKAFEISSIAIVAVGEENSSEFINKLDREGLTLEKIVIPGRIRENVTVHTNDGEETRISFGSSEAPENLLQKIEEITDSILSFGDILTLTGSIPKGVDIYNLKAYVGRLREKGIRVIVDSRSLSFEDVVDMKPFLIKPNEYEAREYVGEEVNDEADACLAAEKLRALGIENVMITLGGRGAVLASKEGVIYLPAPKIEVLSTVGAGDSAIAGFIYCVCCGYDAEKTLATSIAFGSAACLESGTKPPKREVILKILKNGSL